MFLLGGDPKSPGAISGYAAAKPNLLNVAVTRARRRVYVVGDHAQWARHAYYSELARALPRATAEDFLGRHESALSRRALAAATGSTAGRAAALLSSRARPA